MENTQKKVYEKPEFQVVELELEVPLLSSSPENPPSGNHSPAFYRNHGFN